MRRRTKLVYIKTDHASVTGLLHRQTNKHAQMDYNMKLLLNRFCLFLLLSYHFLLSLNAAAPLSRSLALRNQDEAAVVVSEQTLARMEIEVNDYPGSGANSRHDPRNPGKP
ncbi:hypothetical protein ZIOFF_047165 [Zingiber officinale]|uniref:Uncharacterized protein n=1 Tax=Zingiber officinale TaxID=94328 RepID=A0A8J5KWH4_ZINOF|nr:hypothetical protein ZIOFF_047165 [Zingiber officinale]